ncbi:MAG TPA: asparagine synthase (glutamine-hydrolyzing) [Aliidongia sp.]|nr:asparagine synthase (glutamine-hydrolyzing) [Aliidongia sp.]
MCGLTGFLDLARATGTEELRSLVDRMALTIEHRGPDDAESWVDAEAGVALGFRRLAIVDLTPAGRQPMVSSSGRYVIIFNGEVYNAEDLRPELAALGIGFRGHSDTEIILEACAAWGVEKTVQRLIGMFAIALWDRQERRLTLIRDRMGIKPLYYGTMGRTFFFGSQPKSFRPHPDWRFEVDRESQAAFMRFNYVPSSRSIHRGLKQLPPGHLAVIGSDGTVDERCYWNIREKAAAGRAQRSDASDAEAVEALDLLLRDAVKRRMIADVPLGALLSGGIDSSTVVALMQAQSDRPIKTFSIGFGEESYNEAPHAAAVAKHLGTEHHELYVEPAHALELVPRLAEWYDEPFADASQIPTLLVSELARSHVTVALSGDGGDELFAGYTRYLHGNRLIGWTQAVPRPLRDAGAYLLEAVPSGTWNGIAELLPAAIRPKRPADRAAKLAEMLRTPAGEQLYRQLVSQWPDPEALVRGAVEPVDPIWTGVLTGEVPDFVERMQLIDMLTYLPDDILTKVDRASMAVSLEARVPLIDHRVVEHAFHLPSHQRIRNGETKWLLRRVLDRYVPRALVDRPKMGFGVPIDQWLRGPLRDWAEALLTPDRLALAGLAPDPIRQRWTQHQSGAVNWQYSLWCVLMYQAWFDHWSRPA